MYCSGVKAFKLLLKKPKCFKYMYLHWGTKVVITKFFKKILKPKKYAKKIVFEDYIGNEMIKNCILSGKPFAIGRPGATEIYLMLQAELLNAGLRKKVSDDYYKMAYVNSGIFPRTVEFIKKYGPFAEQSLSECDILNVSYCVMEDYVYQKSMNKKCELTYIRALDYWRFKEPWTMALKGKKVVVVSPFAKTIENQYKKRKLLYKNQEILPEITLYAVKAVQTGGMEKDDRFKDWFEALEYMYKEIMKYDFDVAILSCGAYALPLAAMLKKAGKGAIHMGGVCQMLFGIKGRRFEDEPGASDFFNEYWVYPSVEETPKSANMVEQSAYWKNEN